LLTTSFLIWLVAAMIGMGILVLLIDIGVIHANLFYGSKAVMEMAIPALTVIAVGSLVSQPLDVFRLAVRSFQRVDIEQFCTMIFKVVMLALGVFVLAFGGGLLSLALATSLSRLGLGLIFSVIVNRSVPSLKLRPALFDSQMARNFVAPS